MQTLLVIIQVVLMIWLLGIINTKLYDDKYFDKKVTFPLWFYGAALLASFIPILGIIGLIFLIVSMINAINQKDIYYKPGWFIKLLTKKF